MSQLIAFKNRNGILLAADGKAVDFNLAGHPIDLDVQRLFRLGDRAAILAGGAAEGEKICRSLQEFVSGDAYPDIEALYPAALSFLASAYEDFMEKSCSRVPIDPIHPLYFILGGRTETDRENPFRLYLLWPRNRLPYLDGEEIQSAFSIPRSMRLEYRLSRLARENAPIDKVLPEIRDGLERQAKTLDEVGGAVSLAAITQDGFQEIDGERLLSETAIAS